MVSCLAKPHRGQVTIDSRTMAFGMACHLCNVNGGKLTVMWKVLVRLVQQCDASNDAAGLIINELRME